MYAIRQKSTGWFFPAFGKNQSKGSTWMEPKVDAIPRLFRRKQDAKATLDHWLRGQLRVTYPLRFEDCYEEADWHYKSVPGRSADDMEIVEVEVIVK